MKLPNGDRAIVEIAKLRDYCLNPHHEDGKHKARVFAAALGIGQSDAEWLAEALRSAAVTAPAEIVGESRFGTLYVVDFELKRGDRSAAVRSGWIIRYSDDLPRLTTCYVRRIASL